MVLEYGSLQVGQFKSPINTLIKPVKTTLDPALYHTAEFIRGLLDIHLLDAWNDMMAFPQFTGLTSIKDKSKIINEFILYDPSYFFKENQYNFPLAVLCRNGKEELTQPYAVNNYIWSGVWKFQYILPPLTADQYSSMVHFFNAIKEVLGDRFMQGYDPAYLNGVKPLKDYLARCGIQDFTIGVLEFKEKSDIFFPTIELGVYFEEIREMNTAEFEGFDGIDGYVGIVTKDQPNVDDFIDLQIDL